MTDPAMKRMLISAENAIALREEAMIRSVTEQPELSLSAKRRMDELCKKMDGTRNRHAMLGSTRTILIAAIITVLLMLTAAGTIYYQVVIRYDTVWKENIYHVEGGLGEALPDSLHPAFIPERFNRRISETQTDTDYQLVMEADGGDVLAVTVRPADTDQLFDAESGEDEWISLNGVSYFRHRTVTETSPYVFASMLTFSDGRYTISAGIWQRSGFADDKTLAQVIGSIPTEK